MDWFLTLLSDKSSFAHALLAYSLIIAAGLWIGRFKIFGVGIGITCVLFLGLVASFLGVKIDPAIISFFRNFGLVLFVFFIGLQVGPSFFSTLRSSGWGLNGLMCLSVLTSILITIGMYFAADGALPLPQLLGVHFGAVTSTPGLGATQEALHHMGYTDMPAPIRSASSASFWCWLPCAASTASTCRRKSSFGRKPSA